MHLLHCALFSNLTIYSWNQDSWFDLLNNISNSNASQCNNGAICIMRQKTMCCDSSCIFLCCSNHTRHFAHHSFIKCPSKYCSLRFVLFCALTIFKLLTFQQASLITGKILGPRKKENSAVLLCCHWGFVPCISSWLHWIVNLVACIEL